jgi:hypothetical protein
MAKVLRGQSSGFIYLRLRTKERARGVQDLEQHRQGRSPFEQTCWAKALVLTSLGIKSQAGSRFEWHYVGSPQGELPPEVAQPCGWPSSSGAISFFSNVYVIRTKMVEAQEFACQRRQCMLAAKHRHQVL